MTHSIKSKTKKTAIFMACASILIGSFFGLVATSNAVEFNFEIDKNKFLPIDATNIGQNQKEKVELKSFLTFDNKREDLKSTDKLFFDKSSTVPFWDHGKSIKSKEKIKGFQLGEKSEKNSFNQEITESIILNNEVLKDFVWPISISNPSTQETLIIELAEDIYLDFPNAFFIINSSKIKVEGNDFKVYINGLTSYPGLFKNGSDQSDGFSDILIEGVNLISQNGSSLAPTNGWLGQRYFGKNASNVAINNSSSEGLIPANSGGIVGANSKIYLGNCFSTGDILDDAGGLVGPGSLVDIHSSYTTGEIKNRAASGLVGANSQGKILLSYSLGNMPGPYTAGIAGGGFIGEINSCYSTGNIGREGGGIVGGGSNATVINSFTTGHVAIYAGSIFGIASEGKIINSYSTGVLQVAPEGVFGMFGAGRGAGAEIINSAVDPQNTWNFENAVSYLEGTDGSVWTFPDFDNLNLPFKLAAFFKTLPLIETFAPESVRDISATLKGNLVNTGGLEIVEIGFIWSTDSEFTSENQLKLNLTNFNNFTVSIDNLQPETNYFFKSYAKNSLGTSFGEIQSFKTEILDQNIYVSNSGSDSNGSGSFDSPYKTIQFAINQAVNSDSILVAAGIYQENLKIEGKEIHLRSLLGAQETILEPLQPSQILFLESAGQSSITGFTFTKGSSQVSGSAFAERLSSPVFDRCVFTENSGSGGIIMTMAGSFTIKNSLFYNNTANTLFEFSNSVEASPVIIHSTFVNNQNLFSSAGLVSFPPKFYNSIIWSDLGEVQYSGIIEFWNSIFRGTYSANNTNINIDSQFVDIGNFDFRLQNYSPAIGYGNPGFSSPKDLAGNLRVDNQNISPDLGAYENEFGLPSPELTNITKRDGNQIDLIWESFNLEKIESFSIFRKSSIDPNFSLIKTTNDALDTKFTDILPVLNSLVEYTYQVSATHSDLGQSGPSNSLSIAVSPNSIASISSNLSEVVEGESIIISASIDAISTEEVLIYPSFSGSAVLGIDYTVAFESKGLELVAGGNGQGNNANQFNGPAPIVTFISQEDQAIYVAEASSGRVIKWGFGAQTGVILINNPDVQTITDIYVDKNKNIYLVEENASVVSRWMYPNYNQRQVLAGKLRENGSAANLLHSPNSFQVIEKNSQIEIFISDTQNHRVQKWVVGQNEGTTVAGGNGSGATANQLFDPRRVWVDEQSTVFVLDSRNSRIQKWANGASQGETIYQGNQFSVINDFDRDGEGNWYLINKWPSINLTKYSPDFKNQYLLMDGSMDSDYEFDDPTSIRVDAFGDAYIGDSGKFWVVSIHPTNSVL